MLFRLLQPVQIPEHPLNDIKFFVQRKLIEISLYKQLIYEPYACSINNQFGEI